MQMVKNIFIAIVVVWLSVVIFMPKSNLYYKLEEELSKKDIKLNEKLIDDGLFSLTIKDIDIYIKGINIASIKKIELFTLLFYTHISIDAVGLDESLKNIIAQDIEKSNIYHSILSPMNLTLDINSSIAQITGLVDLRTRKVRLDVEDSPNIKIIKSLLKKDDKGWYYETTF